MNISTSYDGSAIGAIKAIQALLGVAEDGIYGQESIRAMQHLINRAASNQQWPGAPEPKTTTVGGVEVPRAVFASDFADATDLANFNACKAKGGTDQECFRVGDNCIGAWGDSTAKGSGPCCALPPEELAGRPDGGRNSKVSVTNAETKQEATVFVRDKMPHIPFIENGCRIDLNPDACELLGLRIPVKAPVYWRFAD